MLGENPRSATLEPFIIIKEHNKSTSFKEKLDSFLKVFRLFE